MVKCTGYFYRPQRSWGKVIFSQVFVILFIGGGRGSASMHDGIPHPPDQVPPPGPGRHPLDQAGTPQDQAGTSPGPGPLWNQAVTPQDQAGTPRPGRHPLGMRHPPGPGRHPPPEQSILGDTVNVRAICILLECNLVASLFLFQCILPCPSNAKG